ncbi:MAG: hypothetical protein ACLFPA_11575 [Dichotomicrobium sp.]
MAPCCDYTGNSPHADVSEANFWRGLAIGLSLWAILVGALVIA